MEDMIEMVSLDNEIMERKINRSLSDGKGRLHLLI